MAENTILSPNPCAIPRSGIYQIRCAVSGSAYIGSSKKIPARWAEHRRTLRRGTSPCRRLQSAWTKHGENAFEFSILEECSPDQLAVREQFYIDTLHPSYNSNFDVINWFDAGCRAKSAAANRARTALITHCPRGHAYDEANTYHRSNGKRMCRACANLRTLKVHASETKEQRERRRAVVGHYNAGEKPRLKRQEYAAAHKAQKRAYDRRRYEYQKQSVIKRAV